MYPLFLYPWLAWFSDQDSVGSSEPEALVRLSEMDNKPGT
jgi:hypothetical protein